MTRASKARAFTLIELIVVIVIIAVLVALSAITYTSIISNSRKTAVDASAAQVAKTIQSASAARQAPIATLTDLCGSNGCGPEDEIYTALQEVSADVTPAEGATDRLWVTDPRDSHYRVIVALSPDTGAQPARIPDHT